MIDFPEREELQILCDAAVEGRLTAETQSRLEQLVLNSPAARQYYIAYLRQHADLQWAAHDPDWLALESPDVVRPAIENPSWRSHLSARWRWMGAAAIAAALAFAVWLPMRDGGKALPIASSPVEEPLDFTVAVLVQATGAEWGGTEQPPQIGAPLPPGWLRLKAGSAQLEFYSGATVILEAPAELQLLSRMEAFCARGKLRVIVPTHAQGFAIGTPKLDLVDLGTEFGVHVGERDVTEVHVFTGKVELYDAGSNRAAASRKELTTGQGLHVSETATPLASNPAAFQTSQDLNAHTRAQGQRRHEQWLVGAAQLRVDPALVAYYTFQTDDPWSRTLGDARSDRTELRHGSIVGCAWSEGRWPLKQALEFKQVSDRMRISIPGEFDSLTLATWVRIDSLPNLNNSLLMSDGWEPGDVHWQIGSSGMLVLGVQSEPKGKGWHYDAPDVIKPDHFGRWIHLAVVYNQESGLVTHYLDGRPVALQSIPIDIRLRLEDTEIGNWNMATHRNITPVRFFSGSMDELMIFSRALSEGELETLYTQGRPSM